MKSLDNCTMPRCTLLTATNKEFKKSRSVELLVKVSVLLALNHMKNTGCNLAIVNVEKDEGVNAGVNQGSYSKSFISTLM